MTLSPDQIRTIAEVVYEMERTRKNDPAATTLTAPVLHGTFPGNAAQFGLFSDGRARPERFSTLVRPDSLLAMIAQSGGIRKSVYDDEILEVMTGVTAASGTNATGWCGNPPTVGQGKVAQLIYRWGQLYLKTNLNAMPQMGSLRNRVDVPGRILNAAPAERSPFIPSLMYELNDTQSQLQYELYLLGVHMERVNGKVLITGDRTQASNATEVGFIKEYNGLDGMIKTGYTDADSGMLAPALDSMIITFNADVGGTIGGGDGRNIVVALTDLYWAGKERARKMGMEGVVFGFTMRPEQWRPLVEVWACNYATYRCDADASAGLPVIQSADDTNRLRLEMLNGRYLLIDGEPVPVVFEEGIPRENLSAVQFKSDIYLVPLSWQGIPLTVLEYFDMNNAPLQEFNSFVNPDKLATLNDGMFLVGYRYTPMCLEYHFAAQFRLILEAPWLAGRVDDVWYTVRTHNRNADPSDTNFYANGGKTYQV